jgi:trimethylamine--corrinoid protein Co-methyltransferase
MLNDYVQPAIDPGIAEALADFVAAKKAAEPDSFM